MLNKQGQKMGRKGLEMRKRIMEKTIELVSEASYRELSVADVAQGSGTSTSTFYVYFNDIEDVLFSCVQEASEDVSSVLSVLKQDWPLDSLEDCVDQFVDTYMKVWEKNAVELRIRNQEADQGNERFLKFRVESTKTIISALEQKLLQAKPEIQNARSLVLVLFTSMERLAGLNFKVVMGSNQTSKKKLNEAIKSLWVMLIKQ